MQKPDFPYKLGHDLSGTVTAIGSSVSKFQVGDEVYSRVRSNHRGTLAQYALSTESLTALKPKTLNWTEAAAIPLACMTALQAFDMADGMLEGGLKGKTVLVPAGLSGTGHYAVQIARCFQVGKIITTVSTPKISKIKELLGERAPDMMVDYTKENVVEKIGHGTVDFMFDTAGQTTSLLPVVKGSGKGVIISISTIPSGKLLAAQEDSQVPWYLSAFMTAADWGLTNWCWYRGGVVYKYLFLKSSGRDLDRLKEWIDEGKVRPVVGSTAKLENIEDVRKGCQGVFDGKGGVGKFVVVVD